MSKLWMIANTMIIVGIALIVGSIAVGLGPIALVCGVLLVWSAIVKVVVLRVWRATLPSAPVAEPPLAKPRSSTVWSELA